MAELKGHIVVVNLPDLRVPHFLSTVISAAAHAKRPRLIIILLSPFFNGSDASASIAPDISHTDKWDEILRILTFTYVQATKVAQDLGNPLMDVDVLLKGTEDDLGGDWGSEADELYCVQGDRPLASIPPSLSALPIVYVEPGPETPDGSLQSSVPSSQTTPPFYPVVVCGGTFDHLHPGHKILLSLGAWIASEKLIVGITDDFLLVKKAFPSVLQSIDVRTNKVRKFLTMFRPGLLYDLVPIVDVYGPTAWDPNIQALVVSKETVGGAKAIAIHREQQGLPALKTFIIDVVSPHHPSLSDEDMEMLKSTKISSTSIREYIVNKKILEEGAATGK